MTALLELHRVRKRFGDRIAVDDVSLELQPGAIFGLLGPNGAGKTTLLRLSVDLLRPDSGTVRLMGAPPGPSGLEQVGYLPEERGLPTRPRALELLSYLGELKGLRRAEARAQARRLLDRVQLEARSRSRLGELSKGNQQKVQIAAALMGRPRLLLLDEPFSGLDPVNRALAVELLRESVADGAAALVSTHQLQEVQQLCERLLLLHRGRALLQGGVAEVRARFADGTLRVRGAADYSGLPAVVHAEPCGRVQGVPCQQLFLRAGASQRDVLREILERGLPLDGFEAHLPSVEEIFVRLVRDEEAQPAPEVLHA